MCSRPSHTTWRALSALAALLFVAQAAHAQDDYDVPDDATPDPNMMAGGMVVMQQNNVEMFDQWVFNRVGGAGQARNKMASQLNLKLDEVERVCGLATAQKKKLDLAGKGDVKRFFDLVDETRRKYQKMPANQNNNIWNDIQPLQAKYMGGLFDPGSLFMKTLHATLSPDQADKYAAVDLHHRQEHHHATIDWFIAHLDKGIGLSPDQSQALSKLMHEKTRPPTRFGQGDYYFMLFQLSRIPEAELKSRFDDIQWKLMSQQIQQGKGMEQWLKQQGIVEDDSVALPKPLAALPATVFAPATAADKDVDRKPQDDKKADGEKGKTP